MTKERNSECYAFATEFNNIDELKKSFHAVAMPFGVLLDKDIAPVPTIIQPGAFSKTFSELNSRNGLPVFLEHETDSMPLGRARNLVETQRGGETDVYLDTSDEKATTALRKIKNGSYSDVSVRMLPIKAAMRKDPRNGPIRFITEAKLLELSLTGLGRAPGAVITETYSVKKAAKELFGFDLVKGKPLTDEDILLFTEFLKSLAEQEFSQVKTQLAEILAGFEKESAADSGTDSTTGEPELSSLIRFHENKLLRNKILLESLK